MKKTLALPLLISLFLAGCNSQSQPVDNRIRKLQKLVKESGDQHVAHYDLGKIYMDRGDYKKAIDHFTKTTRINNKHIFAHYHRGLSLYYLKNYSQAEKFLQKALNLRPEDPNFIASLGTVYLALNNPKRAMLKFRQALLKDPKHLESKNGMAISYFKQGQVEEAIKHWKEITDSNPDFPEVYNNLGVAYEKLGRHQEAIDQYKAVLESHPDYWKAHYNHGVALAKSGKHPQALAELQKAASIQKDDAKTYAAIGWVYEKINRTGKAALAYKTSLRMNRGNSEVQQALGKVYADQDQLIEAIDTLKKAKEFDPKNAVAFYNLSLIYDQLAEGRNAVINMILAEKFFKNHGNTELAKLSGKHLQKFFKKYNLKPENFLGFYMSGPKK